MQSDMAQSKKAESSELSTANVADTTDRFHALVQDVLSQVCSSTSVRSVFGEPVTRDNRTIIPVASVYAGFGAGLGLGARSDPDTEAGTGGGMGLGAGYVVQPWGVWEINQDGVQFRRAKPPGIATTLFGTALSLLRVVLRR
jgi:uncharacterized spore protein YtfJ